MSRSSPSTPPPGTDGEVGSSAQRERRKRILDTAIALASEGGFDAVQMRVVAEQAEVALGTLYRYFPSKIHVLVTALGRELEAAEASWGHGAVPGDTAADRVLHVLHRLAGDLQGDRHLAEALTRAFMFADSSVQPQVHHASTTLTRILTAAMRPDQASVTEDDVAIARIVGDVWLSALMGWVNGRLSDAEVVARLDRAVRLILRS